MSNNIQTKAAQQPCPDGMSDMNHGDSPERAKSAGGEKQILTERIWRNKK